MSDTKLKDLVEYIAKVIVDDPAQVQVTEIEGATSAIIELSVAQEEMGRIIGRGGRVANAIRILLRSLAAKEGKRVTLEIIEKVERK
jgi:hypothetical protein